MADLVGWYSTVRAVDVFHPAQARLPLRQGVGASLQGRFAEGGLRLMEEYRQQQSQQQRQRVKNQQHGPTAEQDHGVEAEDDGDAGYHYDYVIVLRIDQGFRDSALGMLRWETTDAHARAGLSNAQGIFQFHESMVAFPACMTGAVLAVLHSGCVERSSDWDFGKRCWDELVDNDQGVGVFGDGDWAPIEPKTQAQAYVRNGSVVLPIDGPAHIKHQFIGSGGTYKAPRFWFFSSQRIAPGFEGEEAGASVRAGLRELEFLPRPGDEADGSVQTERGFVRLSHNLTELLRLH
jgi:hypothetical protein